MQKFRLNIYFEQLILLTDYLRNCGTSADELLTTTQPKWIPKLHVHVHQQCRVVQCEVQLIRHGSKVYGREFDTIFV